MTDAPTENLKRTPLDSLHRELGGRMVPFAGYEMPVQYEGILAEHLHTRSHAGLFDVSHMGQARLRGADADAAFETLVPGDVVELAPGRVRYTMFTNEKGGILDDLMIAKRDDHLFLVVNAACKDADFAHVEASLAGRITMEILADRALLALQGPEAATVMARLAPGSETMSFMTIADLAIAGIACQATRSGYTGEDGFEISVPAARAEALARLLLAQPEVKPIGLGARDSLRLEAGLCLYGSDIDETTTPIEASLLWTISKRRRAHGGFPGAAVIQEQIAQGVSRRRVGILPEGKAPARAHTVVTDDKGAPIGEITSGGYGPSVGGPVAIGYVKTDFAAPETPLRLIVRERALPARVVRLPFTEHRYFKG
ncbi:MAG: glycine cleavage system aminomethyltransferase GcvT [Rhodospirillales bacterium]|jgi:aminomethyltransferase|nr:glycine cleavage system aminomethyltransferase GcvT [Rhodospirillales bacterium]